LFAGKNMTPLQHAVFSGNLPVVRYLLDHGADLHQEGNLEGHDGLTALHTAALKGINTKKTSLMSSFSFLVDIPWSIYREFLRRLFSWIYIQLQTMTSYSTMN